MKDLLTRLQPFQVTALSVDVVWVFGPRDPLPGRWDCKIKYPTCMLGGIGVQPVIVHGTGVTPDAALADAVALVEAE